MTATVTATTSMMIELAEVVVVVVAMTLFVAAGVVADFETLIVVQRPSNLN